MHNSNINSDCSSNITRHHHHVVLPGLPSSIQLTSCTAPWPLRPPAISLFIATHNQPRYTQHHQCATHPIPCRTLHWECHAWCSFSLSSTSSAAVVQQPPVHSGRLLSKFRRSEGFSAPSAAYLISHSHWRPTSSPYRSESVARRRSE